MVQNCFKIRLRTCYIICLAGVFGICKSGYEFLAANCGIFFYNEDFEFTSRLARQIASCCVINSVIVHYQEPSADLWLSPRRYKYFVRNRFATIRFSGSKKINKNAKVWLWVFKILGGILIGKIPVGAVVPMLKGLLFFRPKIKYPVRG